MIVVGTLVVVFIATGVALRTDRNVAPWAIGGALAGAMLSYVVASTDGLALAIALGGWFFIGRRAAIAIRLHGASGQRASASPR